MMDDSTPLNWLTANRAALTGRRGGFFAGIDVDPEDLEVLREFLSSSLDE